MVSNLSLQNSLVSEWLSELRQVGTQNDRQRFRKNLERLGEVAAYEISQRLPYIHELISTPMGEIEVARLEAQPVVATILRAGIPMHQGLLNYFDKADAAFVAGFRKHYRDGSFEIEQQYITSPELTYRDLVIADPMLASGASLELAIRTLCSLGEPRSIYIVSAIACTVGIDHIKRTIPEAHIVTGAIDDELTARGYIVPGLGDAGDLSYGPKMQA